MLQTQQFLCPSNSQLVGTEAKKTNNDTTAIMLYSPKKETGHERTKGKSAKKTMR